MSMNEASKIETLRREFQNVPTTAKAPEDCPDQETIWAAAAGEVSAEERRRVVSHLSTCAECAHAWRLAWALQAEMRAEAEESASHNGHANGVVEGPWKRWKQLAPHVAAAALLLVALGVGVMIQQPETPPPAPVHRGVVDQEIQSLIPEGEALPREDFVLRWDFPDDDAIYDLRVMTPDLREVLHEKRAIHGLSYEVPARELREIAPSEGVVWTVQARSADGVLLAEKTFRTTVR